ncbi:MAG: aminoglycoside phosphotransferase family protein [Ruminococcaceae bacterium]|nr:aminoglycoside phosphotransferase family protein [Oscillospiraceae bacterium]
MAYSLKEILQKFDIEVEIQPYGDGHINDTYLAQSTPKYILQRINTNVFKRPDQVMENVLAVTEHLRKQIEKEGGDPLRETLMVVKTVDGENYLRDGDDCYRAYRFIEGASTYNLPESTEQMYHAAKAIGKFQKRLADFPAEQLHETIVQFHDTPNRVEQLKQAIRDNLAGRLDLVQAEIEFATEISKYASIITDAMESGEVPLRVTHNDTKLNNIMLDDVTGEGVCVIDLDTVMPGSLLYDYGDALRFGASSGPEDEKDLDKIYFVMPVYEAFTKGFLEEAGESMTEKEKELLPWSIVMMTYECGIRFLADYLNGDTYFKTHYPEQNLDRARTQFKLVKDQMEKLNLR